MKNVKHYFFTVLAIIAAVIAYSYLQGCYFFSRSYLVFGQYNAVYLALVTVLILFIIFWLYKKQLLYRNNWQFNQAPHWKTRKAVIAFLAFVLIIIFQILFIHLLGGMNSANQQTLNKISNHGNRLLFNMMVVFIAPFCEEVIFRGMFFNLFFTKATTLNKICGCLLSGLAFAYVHDPNFTAYIFLYWIMGIILAAVYLLTRDLRYSMATHMLNNLLSILPSLL